MLEELISTLFEEFFPAIIWIVFGVFALIRRAANTKEKQSMEQTSEPQARSSDEFVTSSYNPQSQLSVPMTPVFRRPMPMMVSQPMLMSEVREDARVTPSSQPTSTAVQDDTIRTKAPLVSLESESVLNGIVFSMILAPRKYGKQRRKL